MKKTVVIALVMCMCMCFAAGLSGSMPAAAAANTGWTQDSSGKWHYYQNGKAATGWIQVGNKWFYLDASGVMQTGWVQYKNAWYFLKTNGSLATGWTQDGSKWYYLDKSGKMQTGWIQYDDAWYFLKSNGSVAANCWVQDGGKWYYFGKSGTMQTGWIEYKDAWYLLKSNGSMATGWVKDGDYWYYLDTTGKMQTGWLKYEGDWYYLKASGKMATGDQTIDGTKYRFDSDGIYQRKIVEQESNVLTEDIADYVYNLVNSLTTASMSKEDKLWTLFSYIADRSVYPYDLNRIPYYTGIDWPVVYTHDMMYIGASTCHGYSALFGYAAKLCGYKNVYWCCNTYHAWVEIDGLIYDPVFRDSDKHTLVYGWTYEKGIANAWLGAGYENFAGYAGSYQYLEVPEF